MKNLFLKASFIVMITIIVFSCNEDESTTNMMEENEDVNGDGDNGDNTTNQAPKTFGLISVINNATDVDLLPTLIWETTTDPDQDTVTYDVYLDENTEPNTLIAEDLSDTQFVITNELNQNTTYYWRVTAKDNKGGSTNSDDNFTFTTFSNTAPASFNLTSVANNATDVEVKPTLRWEASIDPDGDMITYDVYLDKNTEPTTLIAENLSTTQLEITSRLNLDATYYWRVVAKDNRKGSIGSQSVFTFTTRKILPEIPVTSNAPFAARQAHNLLVFNNKLWVIGGFGRNDTWSTTDGITWIEEAAQSSSNSYIIREYQAATVFNNKMWVIAGMTRTGSLRERNDVWSSADGINWTRETTNAGFSTRISPTAIAFNNKLWIIGGSNKDEGIKSDIWSSTDGVNWTEEVANAPFGPSFNPAVTIFQDKLWVIGGGSAGTSNNIWSSSDGINWTEVVDNPPFTSREEKLMVFDNKLWVIAGTNSRPRTNLWSSSDGVNWIQETNPAPFPSRNTYDATVYNNKIWVVGGFFNSGFNNDVWALY